MRKWFNIRPKAQDFHADFDAGQGMVDASLWLFRHEWWLQPHFLFGLIYLFIASICLCIYFVIMRAGRIPPTPSPKNGMHPLPLIAGLVWGNSLPDPRTPIA